MITSFNDVEIPYLWQTSIQYGRSMLHSMYLHMMLMDERMGSINQENMYVLSIFRNQELLKLISCLDSV